MNLFSRKHAYQQRLAHYRVKSLDILDSQGSLESDVIMKSETARL